MRALVVALSLLALALLIGSRFYPRIESVAVTGNAHYDDATLIALAGAEPGAPLLWVNRWSLARLVDDPWIEHASVVRVWPDSLSIVVRERTPALSDGATTWSLDGTVLPGADPDAASLIRLEGWGAPREREAFELARVLEGFRPEVISYTPEGFDIQLSESSLFTPGVEELKAQWAAWVSQPGRRVAVYPWGVSIEHE